MVALWILSASLVVSVTSEAVDPKDRSTYQTSLETVGRDPEAHVRLSLWCQAHGLSAESLKHLTLAVLFDPSHARARGLLGLVSYHGRWLRPESIRDRVQADQEMTARLDEYRQRRKLARFTAKSQWELGLWCESQGLTAEAAAHFTAVTQIDPSHEAAWKRLGYKKHQDRWMTDREISFERIEAETQKQANRQWQTRLETWRGWLNLKSRRADAEAALAGIVDPRAVPAVWTVFANGSAERQRVAVQVFGQIDSPDASRSLAMLAVFSPSTEVRRVAIETLKRRDAREFAPLLIALLRDPIKYRVKPVGGPGSPGQLRDRR